MRDESSYSTRSQDQLLQRALQQCTPELLTSLFPITLQQARVLRCFIQEPNDKRIARALNLSVKTVSAHLDHIRLRLGICCRMELTQHVLVNVLARPDRMSSLGKSPNKNVDGAD